MINTYNYLVQAPSFSIYPDMFLSRLVFMQTCSLFTPPLNIPWLVPNYLVQDLNFLYIQKCSYPDIFLCRPVPIQTCFSQTCSQPDLFLCRPVPIQSCFYVELFLTRLVSMQTYSLFTPPLNIPWLIPNYLVQAPRFSSPDESHHAKFPPSDQSACVGVIGTFIVARIISWKEHTENCFRNLVNPNQFWIVITLFRSIQHQQEFRLVLNLLKKGNYNQNWVWIYNIPRRYLCVNNISTYLLQYI